MSMKKLLLISIFIGGCATIPTLPEKTSETPLERATFCKIKNIDGYYGSCWINRSKSDSNFLSWINTLQMQTFWETTISANKDILKYIETEEFSLKQANLYFDEVVRRFDEQKTLSTNFILDQEAERTEAFRRAMGNLSRQMKENRDAFDEGVEKRKPISTGQERRLLKQTLLSDRRRSCVYGTGSNQKIFVTAVGERCPSSM